MVKTEAEVRAKMTERVSTAGKYLKAGMDAAEDPMTVISRDMENTKKKIQAGLAESIRNGSYEKGIKDAASDGTWTKSIGKAAQHFEDAKDEMVNNAMNSYSKRASAIEAAQKIVASMPTTTREQRIAKSTAYQKAVAAEFDKAFGRKA